MRISEMQRREPFEQILSETLTAGWSEQYGRDVRVWSPAAATGEAWLMQPLLSACFRSGLGTKARHFVRDSFRYTPVAWRRPAQWLLGTLLTSSLILPRISQPAFRVSGLPQRSELLVLPGNQRVRVFDFERGVCRVMAKHGFERRLMQREIELRGRKTPGLFPEIIDWAEDGRWFEEPILDGYALPRLPRGYERVALEATAFEQLNRWQAQSAHSMPSEAYLADLRDRLQGLLAQMTERYAFETAPQMQRWIDILCRQCRSLTGVDVAETHGDFQPGNILIGRRDRRVWLIDWEHSRRRWRYYDQMVYALRTRSLPGVAARLARFADGEFDLPQLQPIWSDGISRRAVVALLILEDTAWYAAESVSGPYRGLPDSWMQWCQALASFGNELETLFTLGAG